jgi:ribonuclease HI
MSKPKVEIYCDGSCPVPQKEGGWAYILRLTETGTEKTGSGGEKTTTNNRMELMALLEALKVLPVSCDLTIVGDSQYVLWGVEKWMKGWKKKGWKRFDHETKQLTEVANVDLWKEMDALLAKHTYKISWVKGHAGHSENERCDQMAGEETRKQQNL